VFGAHRFYVGKTGSGVAMLLLTLTGVGVLVTGVWHVVDWILIVCGAFRDAEGRRLMVWT
jgi:TM2 domain-containing membrane protein YozV